MIVGMGKLGHPPDFSFRDPIFEVQFTDSDLRNVIYGLRETVPGIPGCRFDAATNFIGSSSSQYNLPYPIVTIY